MMMISRSQPLARRPAALFVLRSQQARLVLFLFAELGSARMAAAKKSSPNGKQKSPKGKGKAAAAVPPSPPAKVSSPPPAEVEAEDNDLLELAESITAKAHLLAPGLTDAELAQKAQDVVKASFDRGAFF